MTTPDRAITFSPNPTTTIITTLTTAFEIFAGLINNGTYREGAVALSPLAVLLIVIIGKNCKKEYEFYRGKKCYRTMISDLEIQKNLPGISKQRKNEIQAQINKHQATLDQMREENIKIVVR